MLLYIDYWWLKERAEGEGAPRNIDTRKQSIRHQVTEIQLRNISICGDGGSGGGGDVLLLHHLLPLLSFYLLKGEIANKYPKGRSYIGTNTNKEVKETCRRYLLGKQNKWWKNSWFQKTTYFSRFVFNLFWNRGHRFRAIESRTCLVGPT